MVENKPNINEILSASGIQEAAADSSGRAPPLNHAGRLSPPKSVPGKEHSPIFRPGSSRPLGRGKNETKTKRATFFFQGNLNGKKEGKPVRPHSGIIPSLEASSGTGAGSPGRGEHGAPRPHRGAVQPRVPSRPGRAAATPGLRQGAL